MPRLGVITDEISEDLDHALAVCKELDINVVELRSVWGTNIVDLDDAQLTRLEAALKQDDMTVCAIASPFLKCHIDRDAPAAGRMHSAGKATRSEQWGILETSLDLADRFNAPVVRAFSFWRLEDPDSAGEDILDTLRDATDRTAARGRLLGLENEHACNIATGEEAAWYFDRIADRTLGIIWDPGNQAALGSVPYPHGYNAIRNRIHHVHLKDIARIERESAFTTMGEGAIAYEDQFRALVADGYKGVLSIETHFKIDGDGEPATRACTTGTRALARAAGLDLWDTPLDSSSENRGMANDGI